MIFTDFAPNETVEDAKAGLTMLLRPWKWRNGEYTARAKRRIKHLFFPTKASISLFLTGRAALYTLLKTLELPHGTFVLVPAFTCEAVILPILAVGHTPIYVDINKEDFSFQMEDLKKKYSDRCKILLLQHTFGITPMHRDEIINFAKEKNIIVIEDVAHGFQPQLFKKNISSFVLLSFGRSKSFSSVMGGAIVTTNSTIGKKIAENERLLNHPSWTVLLRIALYKPLTYAIRATYDIYFGKILHIVARNLGLIGNEISQKEKNGTFDSSFVATYPNIAAFLLLIQLRTFNDVSNKRNIIAKFFTTKLQSYATLPINRFPYLSTSRAQLLETARKRNILLGNWYTQPVAPPPIKLENVKYIKGSCPKAESICDQIVNLPLRISRAQAHQIIKCIHND